MAESDRFLLSNAPQHWPGLAFDDFHAGEHVANAVKFATSLKHGFERADADVHLDSLYTSLLADDGVLELLAVVFDEGAKVPVFFYDADDAHASEHFAGVALVLRSLGWAAPVYYSMKALTESAAPTNPLRPFGVDLLKATEGSVSDGPFAVWWNSDDGEHDLLGSSAHKAIRSTYEALDGFTSYVFAALMRSLGAIEKNVARAQLPDELVTWTVAGPESLDIVLSACAEKGIRFHFNTSETTAIQRDRFLKLFSRFVKECRAVAEKNNFDLDPDSERQALPWFRLCEKEWEESGRKGEKPNFVGVLGA